MFIARTLNEIIDLWVFLTLVTYSSFFFLMTDFMGFLSIHSYHLHKRTVLYLHFSSLYHIFYIALARIFFIVVNMVGESQYLCLVPDLKGKACSSTVCTVLAVGFFGRCSLSTWGRSLFLFWGSFYHKWVMAFFKDFSAWRYDPGAFSLPLLL